MNLPRRIGLLILILLVVFQFVQPVKNKSTGLSDNDIRYVYDVPEAIHQTFVKKCYDCHSNNTEYPWYFNIQPIGWWLAAHVHEGKEHLNFSDFKNYDTAKRANQLEDLQEVVEDGSMPLSAYVTFHPDAELTSEDKQMILRWIKTIR